MTARTQLFVTCLVDVLRPGVGKATTKVLESAGCAVEFPRDQGCCGQPAFNVGMWDEARTMAAQTLDVLDETEGDIVLPSGSCAAMMVAHYPTLFAGSEREEQVSRVTSRVYELTQYLVDVLDAPVHADCEGCDVAYHYSCHGLRSLGLKDQADSLLEPVQRAELAEDDVCCGFGGVFSVEMPAVSAAILERKLDNIVDSGATVVVGGDVSCLVHIEGGLRRRDAEIEVQHISEILVSDDG